MQKFNKYERLKLSGTHLTVGEHLVTADHPQHWHDYFELELILSGSGRYVINDVAYDIKEGCIFFSTPTDFHYLEIEGETKLINVSFDEEAIGEEYVGRLFFSDMRKFFALNEGEYRRALCVLELLAYECSVGSLEQKGLLEYLIGILLRKSDGKKPKKESEHSKGIKNAIIYMALHFKEQITLSDVAREAGYNPSYFTELFKKATGEGVMEHVTRLRIGYAKMMLSGGFSVSDAGALSGFGSRTAFLESFKRIVGMPPSGYRRRTVSEK